MLTSCTRRFAAVLGIAALISLTDVRVEAQSEPPAKVSESGELANPDSRRVDLAPTKAPATPPGITSKAVEAVVKEVQPRLLKAAPPPPGLVLTDPPVPAREGPRPLSASVGDEWVTELIEEGLTPEQADKLSPFLPAKSLVATFDSTDFDTNATNAGSVFIPPDPHGAAGPNHVVNAANVSLRFHQKDGTLDFDDSLANFFASLSPANATFDPKVIYDQFAGRWLVLTLERTTAPEGSRILLAVSDDSDPNGSWTMAAINALFTISLVNHWSDYPGFAVDEEAVYIAVNLFTFPGAFGGNRLFLIDKGLGSGGFYDGGTLSSTVLDPVPGGFFASTQQPAHVFGTAPAGVGTWLALYSGLSNGVDESIQLIRIGDPLGTPTLLGQFVNVANIDNTAAGMPDAPQSGSATLVETNDRRTLDAVWRDGSLWVTTTVNPNTGPDAGQATAHWVEIDTTNLAAPARADGGNIGGEDIATSAHTFFPSIAVNDLGHVGIGFSASAGSIFAGSYYTNRRATDAAGTVRASRTLRAGLASYVRTFGGPRNRWGDYTGTAVDPSTGCFWFYNEHAIAQGTPTNPGPENGRWGTAWGLFCSCAGDESTGDSDLDDVCDDVDACPGSDDSNDADSDGVPDGCDICPGSDDSADADGDGVPDGCDICPGSDDSNDADGDGVPDGCDACAGFDDSNDADSDGVPDACDACTGDDATGDTDFDGICDDQDTCLGDDATGNGDSDAFCADRDCDDQDTGTGDCSLLLDNFESGNTSSWG